MIAEATSPTKLTVAAKPTRDDFIRAHYRLQKDRFFTDLSIGQDGIHASSDLEIPMWNHSMWIGEDAASLAEVEAWHTQRGRRPVYYSIDERRLAEGYERFDRETWMVRDVSSDDSFGTQLTIEKPSDLSDFKKVFRAAFSSSAAYDAALEREGPARQINVLARLGREPIAVGSVGIDGELACVYNVGTTPRARGKGAGSAIIHALIEAARDEGCRWMFLQVESGSSAERLYGKLGFKPLFTRTGFRKSNWTATAQLQECQLSKALGFRGKVSSPSESREAKQVPAELSEKIRGFCFREEVAPESLIVGAWALLLARYSNSNDSVFGVRFAGESWENVRRQVSEDAVVVSWLRLPNLSVEASAGVETSVCFGSNRGAGNHFLTLHVASGAMTGFELVYRSELFTADFIRRLAGHFLALLESITINPGKSVRELDYLTPREREELLGSRSRGPEIKWSGESVVELIEAQARRSPEAIALISEGEKWTFNDLMRRSAERACGLLRAGVKPGDAVGILLPRSLEVVVTMLAIWRAGGIFVPLDSSYPADRLQFMAGDSRMKLIVTCGELAALAPAVPRLLIDSGERFESASSVKVEPKDPAYIIYTSGSTGQPKGVAISHGAIARHVLGMIDFYEITPRDRHLHFSPFTFDASFEQLLPPLAAGASVVVREEQLWDVSEFVGNISRFGLTMVDVPMAYWHQLAQFTPEKVPSHLRLVVAGGEAMAPDRLAQWQQGPFASCRLVNAYGPTEATVTATAFDAANFTPASGSVPIGKPLAGRVVYILNDSLQPAPIRVAGQVYIGGPLLAEGYLNRPELTREKFVKNPFGEGNLYATGDLGRLLEDGSIEFLGRSDDQVKIRGFRIEPSEIEVALQEHPSVREAVVVARGSAEKRLAAYVTSHSETTPASERELRSYLRARLPEYMVPSAIVVMRELPLLNSGKVNRKALPEPGEVAATSTGGAVPKTPLELQLQILFQRVLRRSGVAVDESFFELGGDSLQALELIVQIEKATGRRLPLETLFQTPTVQSLASQLGGAVRADDWTSLVTLQKSGTRRPIFLVHTTPGDVLGYGNLIHHLGSDQPCYGFQALGLKDGARPHDSIEAMAAHYVELLRKFQPSGPYILGGWCFGGIVAVEMAQQLREAGQEVAELLLMETISVSPGPRNLKYHLARYKCLFSMSLGRWRDYLAAKARYRRQVELDNRMRFKQAGDNVDPEQRRWLERLEEVYNANLSALNGYRSRPWRGKVTLFNAVEKDPGILPDPNYGWTGLADQVEIYEVAGNHDTMLAEPNVTSLATAIRKTLSRY